MFGISFEHILILGVILIIVGPKKLPALGNQIGKGIKNFKDSLGGIEEASFKRLNTPETPNQTQSGQTAQANPPSQTAHPPAPVAASAEPNSVPSSTALASGGASIPPNSPAATAAPLAAGTASVTDPSHSDPHKS